MEKRMMGLIALIVGFLLMLVLLLVDGFSGLIAAPPRRELQASMAATALLFLVPPFVILCGCGMLVARFKRLGFARAVLSFASVMFAFCLGAAYAWAAALRHPLALPAVIALFAAWILWYERRRGGGLPRRALLSAITVAAWGLIRLIAG